MPPVKLLNPKQGIEISVHNLSSHADMKGMAVYLAKPRLPVEQPISENFGLDFYTKAVQSVETSTGHRAVES